MDADGVITAATGELQKLVGQDNSGSDYIRNVRSTNRAVFSHVVNNEYLQQYTVSIATPVLYQDKLSGVLEGIILLGEHNWDRDLGPTYGSFSGSAILLDVSGNIIFDSNLQLQGINIRTNENMWELVALREPQSELIPGGLLKDQIVASFAPIPGTYWGLITEEAFNAIMPSLPYQLRVIGPLLVVMMIFIILWLVFVQQISHPIAALVQAADNFTSGFSFGQLTVEGPLELRTIITTINQLASRVNEQRIAQHEYAKQVLKSQEEERSRLSRELHDEIVQTMVSIGQRLELASNALDHNPDAARIRLNEMQVQVKEAISNVRQMSNDLRPAILEDLGLAQSIGSLCDDLSQQFPDMNVQFVENGDIQQLKPEYELTVYRVVQEALNNIRKHGGSATLVRVCLEYDKRSVQVTISDNGPGFSIQEPRALMKDGHLGLVGMYDRAQLFGGNINVQSTIGTGTTITMKLNN
jgi:signal transduction histidine kinase